VSQEFHDGANPVATAQTKPAPPVRQPVTTNPYIGILGVFFGAALATLNSRLLSVGLADLRGATGFGFDEASWLPSALNMTTMFSGVFVVFVNSRLGPRRILLPAAAVFTVASVLAPLAPGYWAMLAVVGIAGMASGTFYSLTMTFVLTALPKRLIIFGIAAYAADIVFISNFASAIEAWYVEHLSWHWIFWNAALFTPLMMLCVYFGIPQRTRAAGPKPSWQGFVFFSLGLSLLYGAMDQGERLDWFHSGTIVAMSVAGIFLVAAAGIRRLLQPNPTLNLAFLNTRNIVIIGLSIFAFKFLHLATIVLVPNFLGTIQQYRALEIGHALAWVAAPMFAVVWLVAFSVIYTNSRLILAVGLTIAAVACWFCARLDSSWAGNTFQWLELALSCGFACTYVGLVSSIVLEGLDAGALGSVTNMATLSGFMHFVRIFGGQIGVAVMTRLITVRERFHSNLLGLHVQAGDWLTDERVRILTAGLAPGSSGIEDAQARAIGILSQQVRAQAYTMAIADAFVVIAWMAVAYLLLMLFLRSGKMSCKVLRNAQ
jgi:MFS transporter, DHA2 family, multidrug resistance protein